LYLKKIAVLLQREASKSAYEWMSMVLEESSPADMPEQERAGVLRTFQTKVQYLLTSWAILHGEGTDSILSSSLDCPRPWPRVCALG
jgi:hypothetical protein